MEINNVKTLLYSTTIQSNSLAGDITQASEEISLINVSPNVDEVVLSTGSAIQSDINIPVGTVTYAVTTETPMADIQNIKEMLYKIHHPADGFVSGGNTQSNEIGDAWDIIQHINKDSDSTVNVNTGVSRVQLLKITQKDDWAAANQNIFGKINRVFDELDSDHDDVLSYSELKTFTGYELGSTSANFDSKIENYSKEIQRQYAACTTATAKLNFVIDKARDYLTAMGLNDQIAALNRLQTNGKISFASLDSGTLGVYSCSVYVDPFDTSKSLKLFFKGGTDKLELSSDYNSSTANWYDVVSTLVHELTHATACIYSGYDPSTGTGSTVTVTDPTTGTSKLCAGFESDTLDRLYNAGCISLTEYDSFMNALEIGKMTRTQYYDLIDKTRLMWGEYSAYQTNEDYLDSVAGGQYLQGNTLIKGYGDFGIGGAEDTKIDAHIKQYYVNEPKPSSTWWVTYDKMNYTA